MLPKEVFPTVLTEMPGVARFALAGVGPDTVETLAMQTRVILAVVHFCVRGNALHITRDIAIEYLFSYKEAQELPWKVAQSVKTMSSTAVSPRQPSPGESRATHPLEIVRRIHNRNTRKQFNVRPILVTFVQSPCISHSALTRVVRLYHTNL